MYVFFDKKLDELFEKCKKILDKVSSTIKKRFDSEPIYDEKYLKTKKIL